MESSEPDVIWSSMLSSKESLLPKEYKVSTHTRTHRHRRFVSGIIYLLFTTTFIYLVAGPWVGWDGTMFQHTVLTVCSTAAFMRWPLKKSILVLSPHRRERRWRMQLYCLIPWRFFSRYWGKIAAIPVPRRARPLVFGVYCKLFGVDIGESEKPLRNYPSLSAFFTRRLRENVRLVDSCGLLVSPCDGTVVQCGPISDKYVKKVKGVDYCIETFLGLRPALKSLSWLCNDGLPTNSMNRLYQCVLYLAPGDYHRFHSPCKWLPLQRLHFCGQLMSVAPKMTRWLPNLLALNERVVYTGTWEHGFFSYTAVGATNVGSIKVHNDPTLETNKAWPSSNVNYNRLPSKCQLERGEEMGFFSMGSTIVLIFEAPENFHFTYHDNDRIKLGSCLGGLDHLSGGPDSYQSSEDHEEVSDLEWSEEQFEMDYEFGGSEKVFVA